MLISSRTLPWWAYGASDFERLRILFYWSKSCEDSKKVKKYCNARSGNRAPSLDGFPMPFLGGP